MDKHKFLTTTLLHKKDGLAYRIILDTCREGESLGVVYQALQELKINIEYTHVSKMLAKLVNYEFLSCEPKEGWNKKYYLTTAGRNALLAVPVKSNPWMEQLRKITGETK